MDKVRDNIPDKSINHSR